MYKQQPTTTKELTKKQAFQTGYCEEKGCNFADAENTAVPTSSLTCTSQEGWSAITKNTEKDNQIDPGDAAATFFKD